MLRNLRILFLSIGFLFLGSAAFFIYNGFIIFNFPSSSRTTVGTAGAVYHKEVKVYFCKNDKFSFENISLIWKKSTKEDLKRLVGTWLGFVYDEQIVDRRSFLETVLVSDTGEAYFSFDSCFIPQEWSVSRKWHFIETLFKTIRGASLNISSAVFLVRHKPMKDEHLDFSQPWTVDGFLDMETQAR